MLRTNCPNSARLPFRGCIRCKDISPRTTQRSRIRHAEGEEGASVVYEQASREATAPRKCESAERWFTHLTIESKYSILESHY